jgi:hypothetical protein
MPLQDYISPGEDDRRREIAEVLESRWSDVLDEAPVSDLQETLDTRVWYAKSFTVEESEVGHPIKARFSFVAEGLDEADRPTGEVITGSAVALIDEYDGVEFTDVTAELRS